MRTPLSLDLRHSGALAGAVLMAFGAGTVNGAPQPTGSTSPARPARATAGATAAARSTGFVEAGRTELRFLGRIRWEALDEKMDVSVERLENMASTASRTLKLELWIVSRPFRGEEQRGWLLKEQSLAALEPADAHDNMELSGHLDLALAGERYAALLVRERTVDGWVLRGYRDLGAVTVPGRPAPVTGPTERSEPVRSTPGGPENPERPRAVLTGTGARAVPTFTPNRQEQQLSALLTDAAGQKRKSLSPSSILARVARERARDMARRGYFDHVNPDGEGPNYLATQAGYHLAPIYGKARNGNNIESIGAGPASAEDAWQLWMNSPGHKAHLLGLESFYQDQTEYGVGYAADPSSPYRHYWVVLIAKPAS